MIPAAFEYHRPSTLQDAIALLGRLGDDAKVLSGGQSLIPLMKLRLRQPAPRGRHQPHPRARRRSRERDGVLRIGALARESELEASELVRHALPAPRTTPAG